MATVDELECNLKAAENTSPLTQEEINAIDEIKQGLGTQFCRRCNYCAPCTVGIPISSVFLFEGYLTRYNLTDWANLRYNSLPVKASACIECGVCETRCPYNLPIRQMLKKAVKGFGE
jgi:predicted aldo/keto reductase-like oxidoreductase